MAQSMTARDFFFFFLNQGRLHSKKEAEKDPETKMSAMHRHQSAVWGKLCVARYGQHSKDSNLEARVSGADGKDGVPFDLVPDQCRPSLRLALLLLDRSLGCKD